MPLVILTGYPCSGKSHRASQLVHDFNARIAASPSEAANLKRTVVYIPSHHSSLDAQYLNSTFNSTTTTGEPLPQEQKNYVDARSNPRDQIYNSAALEKTARAEEFSSIKRSLNKNNIVIADGLNYIKGFRYQLWCEAKAAGTRCVVLHIGAREDEVRRWNKARIHAWGWNDLYQDQEGEANTRSGNGLVGKDVVGDLMPEAHTAIYGDRLVAYSAGNRSRSSSMGGGISDEEPTLQPADDQDPNQKERRVRDNDGMTLKSLFISDNHAMTAASPTNNNTTNHSLSGNEEVLDKELKVDHINQTHTTATLPSPTSSLPYSPSTLTALIMRYEPPSPFTRWDTPLFTVPSSDPHPPYAEIWSAIFPAPVKALSKKALSQLPSTPSRQDNENEQQLDNKGNKETQAEEVRRHAATVLPRATGSEALQILESATGDVVKILLTAARAADLTDGEGGMVAFDMSLGAAKQQQQLNQDQPQTKELHLEIKLPMGLVINQPVLQRLRRKYTQIQRGGIAHGVGYVSGREEIIKGFINFLEAEWDD